MIDDARKKECDARGRRNLLRTILIIPVYVLATWVVLGVVATLVIFLKFPLFGHCVFDRDFDAKVWRTDVNARPAMLDELLEKLEGSNYSGEDLIELLGGEGGDPPYESLTWDLSECSSEHYTSYCYCWLTVDLVDNRVNNVRYHCS